MLTELSSWLGILAADTRMSQMHTPDSWLALVAQPTSKQTSMSATRPLSSVVGRRTLGGLVSGPDATKSPDALSAWLSAIRAFTTKTVTRWLSVDTPPRTHARRDLRSSSAKMCELCAR